MTGHLEDLVASGLLQEQVVLAPLTTYKLGGPARWFLDARSEEDLTALGAALAAEAATGPAPPVLVVGKGSNLAVADSGYAGVVVRLGEAFTDIEFNPGGVLAGGAVSLPVLARRCAREGRGGLEFLVAVPGSVGGAVRMNAGCHGAETADWLVGARIVDLRDGSVSWRDPAALGLRYRHSDLVDGEIVVSAEFRTKQAPPAESEALMREITRWRRDNQPGGTLNAGSVFKNPPGDAAGRLIDACGLKGLRVGKVSVSDRHANFFVAEPEAPAADLYRLVQEVRRRVAGATGIVLEPEIRFVGEFEEGS